MQFEILKIHGDYPRIYTPTVHCNMLQNCCTEDSNEFLCYAEPSPEKALTGRIFIAGRSPSWLVQSKMADFDPQSSLVKSLVPREEEGRVMCVTPQFQIPKITLRYPKLVHYFTENPRTSKIVVCSEVKILKLFKQHHNQQLYCGSVIKDSRSNSIM